MKVAVLGDLHFTAITPKNRTDDYPMAQYKKMEWILDTCLDMGVDVITIAGDVFDRYNVPYWIVGKYINLFNSKKSPYGLLHIIATWGQHDVRYHTSDIRNTPLGVLAEGTQIVLVGQDNGENVHRIRLDNKEVCFYGAPWGVKPYQRPADPKADLNIMLTHCMTLKSDSDKLWFNQTDYVTAGQLLRLGYDLVCSGDNHQCFYLMGMKRQWVINPGCLSRNKITLQDYVPHLHIWDSETKDMESLPIPVAQNVFADQPKEVIETAKLDTVMTALAEATMKTSNFAETIFRLVETIELTEAQKRLLSDIINGRTDKFEEEEK